MSTQNKLWTKHFRFFVLFIDETTVILFLLTILAWFQKYPIWKWCCHEEIPSNELIEYLEKYKDPKDADKWRNIYQNWISWQDIDSYIGFDIILTPAEIPRITCIAVYGRYIAVGSEDGRIRIFNDKWELLYTERHLAVRVTSITFIPGKQFSFSYLQPVYFTYLQ